MKRCYFQYLLMLCFILGIVQRGWTFSKREASVPTVFAVSPTTPSGDTVHGLIGTYYNGMEFNAYVTTRIDSVIQFDWGSGSPFPGDIGNDHFSVRWVGYIKPPVTGTYTFHARSDDGGRLIIGGLDFLDFWGACCNDFTGTIFLKADSLYPFIFEMHENVGGAAANYVDWEAPGLDRELVPNKALYAIAPPKALPKPDVSQDTTHGLIGYYFNDPNVDPKWFDTLAVTRIDPNVDFDWGNDSPIPGRVQEDYFSVRWIGFLRAPVTGTYTFTTNADDNVRLTVAGKEIVDAWDNSCCQDYLGNIDLNAGILYPVIVEFREIGGGADCSISWEASGLPKEKIPQQNFYTAKLETAFKPEVTPDPGIYVDSVKVRLNSLTSESEIHYTLDGSTPSENSPRYTTPIIIKKDTKVSAVTYRKGMVPSVITTANYRIIPPLVSTPNFYPGQGIYDDTTNVIISTKEDSTTIYYTLDGSNPDTTSLVYTGSVEIDSTTRLKAFAVKKGMSPSNVASATYTLLPPGVAAPVFSVEGGEYNNPQSVSITSATPGAVIHYSLGETVLNEASTVYSSPVSITQTTTLKAYAEKEGLRTSDVTIASYVIGSEKEVIDTPSFNIPGGSYPTPKQIVITTATSGGTIYFTIDGSTPDKNSFVYHDPILVSDSMTIKAFATKQGMLPSAVISASYIIESVLRDTGAINDKLPTPSLTISPNPATGDARISWQNMIYTNEGAYLTITDSRGSIVKKVNIKGGYTYYILNTSTLSNGIYFIRIVSGSSVLLGKLIVHK